MGEVKAFFFDTYAFFEIIEGNKNYDLYKKNVGIITTKLNLMELHYGLLIRYGKEKAERYYNRLLQFTVDVDDVMLKKANEFRASLKKKKLSYVDCIGYVTARAIGVKFLTGDKEFKGLDNVEYVE